MLKKINKQIVYTTLIFSIIAIIIVSVVSYFYITYLYKEQMLLLTGTVLENIEEKYGEIDSNIIQELYQQPLNNKNGKAILNKYGIDEQTVDYKIGKLNFSKKVMILLIMAIGLPIIVVIVIFGYFRYQEKKKIRMLSLYAQEVLMEHDTLDIRDNSESEMSILKNKIYDMTIMLREKNKQLLVDKKEIEILLADISHQVKTPLTSLNIINELLKQSTLDNEKRKEFLNMMQKELTKIEWLIKNLLNIAKLDAKTIQLKKEEINLLTFLMHCKENFEIICELKNAEIIVKGDKNIHIKADEKWTMEAINNLIKNALEHGATKVELSFFQNAIYTEIIVKDNGQGISENDKKHIFERFYKSKNSKEGSVGIGLSFVKSIIKNQNGEIKVNSKLGEGTTFYIKLFQEF